MVTIDHHFALKNLHNYSYEGIRLYVLKHKERWLELCALAAEEQDPKQLMELIKEITALLEAKEKRLKGIAPVAPPPTPEST
jgi:hypothetical protein